MTDASTPRRPFIPQRASDFRSVRLWFIVAIWTGLVAGLVEVGLIVLRVELLQYGLHRRDPRFIWMTPVSTAVLFSLLGVILGLLARGLSRHGGKVAAFLLLTAAVFSPLLAVPGLKSWSSLILAGGLSSWLVPLVRSHRDSVYRLIWMSFLAIGLIPFVLAGGMHAREWVRALRFQPLREAPAGAPNVLLIVVDTLRGDALLLDESQPDRTPNLRRLAEKGTWFERAIAPSPWTLPSHASLFTGRWVWELGVGPDRPLDDRFPTLAEHLGRQGYATAGIVANTVFCASEYGLSRGFATYEDHRVTPLEILRASSLGWLIALRITPFLDLLYDVMGQEARHPLELKVHRKDAAAINRSALSWIARQRDRPFFAFLNYLDVHDPYLVPPDHAPRRSYSLAERRLLRDWITETPQPRTMEEIHLARAAYDECLAYLDDQIGRLLDGLEQLGRFDNTVIVLTSDHGEHFGEHARDGLPLLGHRLSLYQPEIHVPMMIVAPGRVTPGTRDPRNASLRDLPATILDLIGFEDDSPFPGQSLVNDEKAREPARTALAEFVPSEDLPVALRYLPGSPGLMRAVVSDNTVLHQHGDGREELYDLGNDPGEQHDLGTIPETRERLESLRDRLRELGPPGPELK